MEAMAEMADKSFDLAIVDPPYGIGINEQMRTANTKANWIQHDYKQWDSSIPPDSYFTQLLRVSKEQIIWGGNYFALPLVRGWIVWDKKQEFSTGEFEMAWNSRDMPTKAFRMARCEAYVGENKIHPTQKPVALYKWLLTNYAKAGDKILDTHLGSGSSRIAAYDLGFDFTGYELDKDYFDAQEERFARHIAQARLFEPVPTIEQENLFT